MHIGTHTHRHTPTHIDTGTHTQREANEYHTLGTLATVCGGMHRLAKTTAKCRNENRNATAKAKQERTVQNRTNKRELARATATHC